MHTLSMFPDLLVFNIFAPFLLRLIVGLFVLNVGLERLKKTYSFIAIFYGILGVLLIIGLYTQLASMLAIIFVSADYYLNKGGHPFSKEKKILYFIIKIILLTLIVTGPGFLAFDLPL
ncbi:MAG: hypothetical protein ABL917_03805 [Parcubacteria group bacterium]